MTKKVFTEEMKKAWNDFIMSTNVPPMLLSSGVDVVSEYIILIVGNKKSKHSIDIKLECLTDNSKSEIIPVEEIKNKNNKLLNNIVKSHEGNKIKIIPSNVIQKHIYLNNNIYDNIMDVLNLMKNISGSALFINIRRNLTKALYEKNKSKNNAIVPLVELMAMSSLDTILANDRFKAIYDSTDKYILSTTDVKNIITQFYEKELEFINSEDFNGIL